MTYLELNEFSDLYVIFKLNISACDIPSLQKAKAGCHYDKSLNENGCPKNIIVCDVKPGQCPTDHEKGRKNIVIECDHSDEICDDAEKCCKIGRSRICVPPVAS
uniref:WAP domain-containing protein n=1 Tax=Romanomermis culicivorax TaxID=13658 RepID=A0A915KKM3_ROMCU